MKKSVLISSILFILGFSYQANAATYYVTPAGSSSNSGLTQGTPWSITHAFSTAVAGDIVYVRSGNYGNINVVQNNNGTSGNLIKFIGCDNSFNPIVTTNRATYTRTDVFSGNDLPFINSGLQNGQVGAGVGMLINGDYVHVENFAVRGFAVAYRIRGDYSAFINLNQDFTGGMVQDNVDAGWNSTTYLGHGIDFKSNDCYFKNIFLRDADAEGFDIGSNNSLIENAEVYTSANVPNTIDYQFLISGTYNVFKNINIIREVGAKHLSHGIVFKPTNTIAEYNVVDGFYCENSKVEFQATTARYNTVKNGKLVNTSTSFASDYAATMITMANGANNNHLENIILFQPTWGIWFENWNENYPNDGSTVGDNNTFANIISINPWVSHLGFRERDGNSNSTPKNVNFYNMTFVGSNLFYNNQATGLVTGGIYNSILSNVGMGNGASVVSSNFIFDKINTSLDVSQFAETNITNLAVSFVDPMTSATDTYDYKPTTSSLDIGTDYTATEPRQGFDFNQSTRTAPFTLGAVEYSSSGGGGGCTATSSVINALIDSGNSYVFNSQTLTNTGVYKDTLVNAGGCDSIITLNLSFNAIYEACKKNNSAQIVIDGIAENLWTGIDSANLGKIFTGQLLPTITDLSANYKIMWDNTSLYILVKVMDDTISSDGPNYINDDAISIYIDGLNDNATSYDANDHNIGLQYGTAVIIHNGTTYSGTGITKSETAITGGYQMEVKIDFSLIGVTPNTSNPIGLDIHVNDDDNGGNRDAKIMWNDASDLAYTNPSKLGMLVLSNECYNYTTLCNNNLSIVIDGLEEPQWTTQEDTLLKIIDGVITNDSDASAVYKLMWDATNLYVLAKITDDIKMNDSPNSWEDDGIEIFIDGDNDKNNVYDAEDRQYIIRWNDNTVYEYGFNTSTNPSGVVFAQTNTPNGYIIEGSIAWSSIGITPSSSSLMGFDIQLNDDDLGGNLDGRRSWNALVSPSGNASLMGVVELLGTACSNTTQVKENTLTELTIYPNPTNDNVFITSEALLTKVELYNSLGELVLTKKANSKQVTISLANLPNGIYSVKTYSQLNIFTKQLIKL